MAIVIVNNSMFRMMPNFEKELDRVLGKWNARPGLVPDTMEILFEHPKFALNEVVILRINPIHRAKTKRDHIYRNVIYYDYKISSPGKYIGTVRHKQHYSTVVDPPRSNKPPWKYRGKLYQVPSVLKKVL